MPFQRRHHFEFPWEKDAEEGREFIASISADDAWTYWTRALRAVTDNGILVVRYHNEPLGVVCSPLILYELLEQRRRGESTLTSVQSGLEQIIKRMPPPTERHTLETQSFGKRPRSIAALLRELGARTGIATIIHRRRRVRAFLIPLSTLARFWQEIEQESPWCDQLMSWMRTQVMAYADPIYLWRA